MCPWYLKNIKHILVFLARYLLPQNQKAFLKKFKHAFAFYPSDINLFLQAFRHKSVNMLPQQNNERLEFLGDSVLSSIMTDFVYTKYPDLGEGFLTQIRSKITNRAFLNKLALDLGFADFVEYDKSIQFDNRPVSNLFGNALEAFIGAIYLDKGYNFTRSFVIERCIGAHINIDSLEQIEDNYKGRLYELVQRDRKEIRFIMEETEEEHHKIYTASVIIDGTELGRGKGYKKKVAEQQAAAEAYKKMTV
jgi:ribonuclease-3